MIKLLTDYLIILFGKKFDKYYYLKVYPDIRKADINPLWHYVCFGWREGRNPSPHFDTTSYVEKNPEVKNLGINPLVHAIRKSKKQHNKLPTFKGKPLETNRIHSKTQYKTKNNFSGQVKNENHLFFHVGDLKTGTSFIQNFLDVNRNLLFYDHNTLYPNLYSEILESGRCHNHGEWYQEGISDESLIIDNMKRVIGYANKKSINKIVLSYENWLFDQDFVNLIRKITQKKTIFQPKIICYLRRVDYWCESAWKQWGLKTTGSFEQYIKTPKLSSRLNYILVRLNLLAEIIGKENIIVRPYEKQQLQDGLIADFLACIDIDYLANHWNETEETNLSLNLGFNRDVLEVLNLCHELYKDVHDNDLFDLFTTLLDDSFKKQPFEKYSLLSPRQRYDIINMNLPYEKEIASKYLKRENGKIFFEPLPDPEEHWVPYDGLNLEKAIPIIVRLIDKTNSRIDAIQKRQQYIEDITEN